MLFLVSDPSASGCHQNQRFLLGSVTMLAICASSSRLGEGGMGVAVGRTAGGKAHGARHSGWDSRWGSRWAGGVDCSHRAGRDRSMGTTMDRTDGGWDGGRTAGRLGAELAIARCRVISLRSKSWNPCVENTGHGVHIINVDERQLTAR